MEIPTIETSRLVLRPWAIEDGKALWQILGEEGVLRYFPDVSAPSLDRVERFVGRQIQHWQDHGYGWWAVELRAKPGLIGWNGLQYLPETKEIELGYLLRSDCWGRGLAAEGGREGLRYGFEILGLERIIAVVHPDNRASQRVTEKLGMTFVEEAVYFGMPVRRYIVEATAWRVHGPGAAAPSIPVPDSVPGCIQAPAA
jgi:ribosomal-protein-alanine N-acetyltransferase